MAVWGDQVHPVSGRPGTRVLTARCQILAGLGAPCVMTTLAETAVPCPVCRTVTVQIEIGSTNCFGSPDLDLRPAEMERSTMPYWVWGCASCGYVWNPLNEDETAPDAEAVRSVLAEPRYQALRAGQDYPELARDFLCHGLLFEQRGSLGNAGWAALRAAWACDDEDELRAAEGCRLMVLELWDRAAAAGEEIHEREAEAALRADVARRAGLFDRARTEALAGLEVADDDVITAVLQFELELIGRKDSAAHTVAEALERD